MKIETFKKRFDFPVNSLNGLILAKLTGRNGKDYYVSTKQNGEPIAKPIK